MCGGFIYRAVGSVSRASCAGRSHIVVGRDQPVHLFEAIGESLLL